MDLRGALFPCLAALVLLPACSKFGRLPKDGYTRVTVGGQRGGTSRSPRTVAYGGAVVWAVSQGAAGQKYSTILTNTLDSKQVDFPNGTWDFYAVAWDGHDPSNVNMDGVIHCGHATKEFAGGTDGVDLELHQDGSDPFFGDAFYYDTNNNNQPKPMNFVTCLYEQSGLSGDYTCDDDIGDLRSFKVVMHATPQFHPVTASPTPSEAIESRCVDVSAASVAPSSLLLPTGEGGFSPMQVSVETYSQTGCNAVDFVRSFDYSHGLAHGEDSSGMATAYSGTVTNAMFFQHGVIPAPTVSSLDKTAGNWGGGYSVTVTGTGFRFVPTPSTVSIGGVDCVESGFIDSTHLSCKVPNTTNMAALGVAKDVVVTNFDSQTGTLPNGFTYQDQGLGNGADGATFFTHDVNTSDTFAADQPSAGRVISANRNVTAITVSGGSSTFTLRDSISTTEFDDGDEVLWHVTAATDDPLACDSGGTLTRGMMGFGRVTSRNSSSITINQAVPGSPDNTKIGELQRDSGHTFCVVQVLRVPNFISLLLNSLSQTIQIKPAAFSYANGTGGIVAVKVSGLYYHNGGTAAGLSSEGKGFAGGAAGTQGDGSTGPGQSSLAANAEGGGRGSPSPMGAGGGAHEGAGGAGAGGSAGGVASFTSCLPSDTVPCAMMGGGGGGGTTVGGGNGGGISLLYAYRLLHFNSGSQVHDYSVYASGLDGSADGSVGSGGGAGGTAFVQTGGAGNEVSTSTMFLNAKGGTGGAGTDKGGGGGGGGTAQVSHCNSPTVAPSFNNVKGVGGTGASAPYNGGDGTNGLTTGRDQTLTPGQLFCPTT